jgi:hypothetical protein
MMGGMGPPAPPAPAPVEKPEGDEDASNSALLPKSLFPGGVKPGDTITLTVSAIYGDEVEASVAPEPTESEESPAMSADEEIDMMGGKANYG